MSGRRAAQAKGTFTPSPSKVGASACRKARSKALVVRIPRHARKELLACQGFALFRHRSILQPQRRDTIQHPRP
jgi:hypothetical protein